MPLPLCSSDQIVKALIRLGFEKNRPARGSHQAMQRKAADGRTDVVVVVLGRKEVPRGTLRGVLETGRISEADFLAALR